MNIRVENWLGHEIRFVEKNPGDWLAVLKDITDSLGLTTKKVSQRLDDEVLSTHLIPDALGRLQEMLIVNEYGIYETIFESRKREAKEFKRWVFEILKQLRQTSGLEGFQVFRMLDKEHQREAMNRLKDGLTRPMRVDFIKANAIANKAVSSLHGYPKMVKKAEMTPNMLMERETILDDTVNLMSVNEKLSLNLSVSKAVYNKYLDKKISVER